MDEIRTTVRALRHRPGFALIAVLTLALGIGANTAIFVVADAALLKPLPYPRADRLVVVWGFSAEVQRRTGLDRLPWSPGDVDDFTGGNRTFEQMAWVRADRVNLSEGDDPERIGAVRVSRPFFDMFRVHAAHGRTFVDADAQGGRVVVIADSLWHRRFNRDPAVLTRPLVLNGQPATVVGVLPEWFRFPAVGDLSQGLGYALDPEIWTLDVLAPAVRRTRAGKSFSIVGRLRDGATLDGAAADLAVIAEEAGRQFPASNAGWTVRLVPLREQLVGAIRPALLVLSGAVGVLLLIACVNVANLLMARATARRREVCVRQALGAERRRLIRQLLIESSVLGVAAGAVGILAARWALDGMLAIVPAELPALTRASLDWRGFAFTAILSLAAGVAFGIVPALQVTRRDVGQGLREVARGTLGARTANRTRSVLVMVEVAAAVVLLVAAVLLARTFVRLVHVDPGFRSEGVLTGDVTLPRLQYSGDRAATFFESLVERLAAIPGVESVAVTSAIPLAGAENLRQVTIEGRERPNPGEEIIADYRVVSDGYFATMGIPLIAGEPLPEGPRGGTDPSLVISKTMAERWFRGEEPLGCRMKLTSFDQSGPWYTIVGVVGDTRHTALDIELRPQVYVHQRTDPYPQMSVVLRSAADPNRYAPLLRAAVTALDRHQPVGRIRTMDAIVAHSIARQRFTMSLVVVFAGLAVVLALVGLYAVVSHSVGERTREMGLRLALGASPGRVLRLVLSESLRLVAAGVAVGVVVALGAAQFMTALLFGVRAYDPLTFFVVPCLLLGAAVAGSIVPAYRAMRVDPVATLRAE
jgi:putative ABC transport system permease protein